jgi:nucleotide-binding universal stress UspA family protein/RimJ/RimL family protein N-acetyltransferase
LRDQPRAPRRRTITLRDGARVILRAIAPEDKPLLAASFERLSEESRYRRFFTTKNELTTAELDYLVDVDHRDHEAIVAIDPSSGEGLGVARYIRSTDDPEIAEVAVTVVDDWQRRGLGRALLDGLTYRARREGVRRFSALVQGDNRASLGLLGGISDTRREFDTGEVELVIELPAKRGIGARLARALRAAAAGSLVPAQTLGRRVALTSRRAPLQPALPIRTIVVGVNDARTGSTALGAALRLALLFGAALHVVRAYAAREERSRADAVLASATRAVRAEGLEYVTHVRRGDPAEVLIAVAEEEHAQLLVVGCRVRDRTSRLRLSSVSSQVSHRAPCSVLIARSDDQSAP